MTEALAGMGAAASQATALKEGKQQWELTSQGRVKVKVKAEISISTACM